MTSAGSCKAEDDGAKRRAEAAALVSALSPDPFGSESTEPSEVRVKGGSPYFVSTGIVDGDRDKVVQAVRDALQQTRWDIRSERHVPHFLGWETLGTKGTDVVLVSVGRGVTDVPNSPYRPLTGRSYVQIAVAERDSGQQWTKLE